MPRGDRTGPGGMGPRTGRAAGQCSGYAMPGFSNPQRPGFGRFGGGRGRGMGWGRWNIPYPTQYGPISSTTPEQEMDFLKSQAEALEYELKAVQKRLAQIESEKESG